MARPATSTAHSVVLPVPGPEAKLSLGFLGPSTDSAGTGWSGPGLSASKEASVSLGAQDSPLPLTSSPKKQPALGTKGGRPVTSVREGHALLWAGLAHPL